MQILLDENDPEVFSLLYYLNRDNMATGRYSMAIFYYLYSPGPEGFLLQGNGRYKENNYRIVHL
jgi:hypothetical protein